MTYDEFVERYCCGLTPAGNQRAWILRLLDLEESFMCSGRQAGKTTFTEWARDYFDDLDRRVHRESSAHPAHPTSHPLPRPPQ